MKTIKASIKKYVGLKFSDQKYNYWIEMFTKDYSKSSIAIPLNYKNLVHSFYYETIPSKDVYSHSAEIEANPKASLPIYLKIDQKIKNQYFDFCEGIKKECTPNLQDSQNQIKEIPGKLQKRVSSYQKPVINNFSTLMKTIVPHLIRFSIGFTYQFERNLPLLLNGTDPVDNTIKFDQLSRFSSIHEMIIRSGIDNLIPIYITYVLSPFFNTIGPQLQRIFMKINDENEKSKEMINFILGLSNPLIDLFIDMSKNTLIENFWSPCFSFISLVSTCSLPYIENGLFSLVHGSFCCLSNIKTIPEASKISTLAFSAQTLIYLTFSGTKNSEENDQKVDFDLEIPENETVKKLKVNYESKVKIQPEQADLILYKAESIGIMAIKVIEKMSDIQSWTVKQSIMSVNEKIVAYSLLDYVETIFYSTMAGNHPTIIDNCKKTIDLINGIVNDIKFTHTPLVQINKEEKEWTVSVAKKNEYSEFPPTLLHLKGGKTTYDIFMLLKSIAMKYNFYAEIICEIIFDRFLERKKDLLTLFFTLLTCKFLPSRFVSSVILRRNSWNFILNDRVLLQLVNYEFDLANIAEEVTVTCFSSSLDSQYSIIEAVSSLFYTSSISRALNIVEQMMINSPVKFVDMISKGSFIDVVFRVESSIRQMISDFSNKTENDDSFSLDELLDLRSRFLSVVKQISLMSASQLVSPNERCMHLISYLFELPLQNETSQMIIASLLCPDLEHSVIECINDFLRVTFHMVANIDWQNMVLKIVDSITEAVLACTNLGSVLIETSIIPTLHKAVIELTEKQIKSSYEFCIKILSFITFLCSYCDKFLHGLITHSVLWELRTTWLNFFLSFSNEIQMRDSDVQLLWRFTLLGDDSVIRNIEGLWLLVSATKPTIHFDSVISKLTKMCQFSIVNRFQCSQADIINVVLDTFTGDNDEKTEKIELIKIIGSSFFKPSELSEFFKKVQMKQSIKLIEIFSAIIQATCKNKFNRIRSFFHIGPLANFNNSASQNEIIMTSKFLIEKTRIDFRPFISFYVRFGKKSEAGNFDFLTVLLNGDVFNFSIKLENLNPIIKVDQSNIKIEKKFKSLEWMKFGLYFGKNDIFIYVNDKEFYHNKTIKTPMMISSISMSIDGVECDVESISISKENSILTNNENSVPVALFSAHVLEGTVCLNIYQEVEYNFQSALFNGISVPFTINVINTISSSGGIRILLPLFQILRKTSDLFFIRAVESIVEVYESMFIDQFFFRALSGILPDKLDVDFFKIFTNMYKKARISELKTEILTNIFCNWSLLKKFDINDRVVYLRTYLPIVIATQPELFSSLFTVKSFFTPILLENEYVWELIDRFCIFQFTNDDFVSMLSAAVGNSVGPTFSLNALKTILAAIDKHDNAIDMLKDFDYFEPFFPVFQKYENEEVWLVVFRIFEVIAIKKPESMPSAHLMNCFSIINLSIITEKTLDQIYEFIFANERSANIQYIKNSQFIPFLCFIMHCFSEESSQKVAKMVYDSISVYDISKKNITKCFLWQFWILYLSNFYKTIEDWISLIAKIPLEMYETVENYTELETLFFVYSEIADLDFHEMMLNYLSVAMTKRASLELVVESFKYIFYKPKRSQQKFKFPPELLRDLKQLSKIINSLSIDWSPTFSLSVRFDTKQSESSVSTKWEDFDLAQKCITFLLSNKHFVSRNVQLSDASIPLSYLLTFAIHIISITNFDFSCQLLPKILSIPSIRNSKQLLCFLLTDFNGKNTKAQNEIGRILCPQSISISENDNKLIQPPTNIEMISLMDILSNESMNMQSYFDIMRDKIVGKLMSILEQTYNQDLLRKVILPNFEEILVENKESLDRICRRNHRIWTSIELELVENGAIWSTVSSEGLHWKIAPTLDGIGGKNQMKVNRHFDNHIDASQARDNEKVDNNLKTSAHNAKVFRRKFKLESILDAEDEVENEGGNSEMKDSKITHMKSATFKFDCTLVTINAYYKGTLYFIRDMISFESYETTDEFGQKKESRPKFVDVRFDDALYIIQRRFLHQQIGAEVFTNKRRGFFFIFNSRALREKFILKMTLSGVRHIKKVDEFTNAWKSGRLTNYEYIFWLNMLSGRSFNDIAQYPVFPWILTDYSSEKIDLNNPSVYRDLSKSIGAMNKERLANLMSIYNDMKSTNSEDLSLPISLFRLHYSTPGYVIYFLIRNEPFTSLHIELQGGKFDHSMRLFSSIGSSYESVVSSSPDYRELIPQFFSCNEFLINSDRFDLGQGVDDVVLPKWAKNASHFVALNRVALESSLVSMTLNRWIDLVFGCRQQDLKSNNLFHPYSDPFYFDVAPKEKIEEIMLHAANFGVNPAKLFESFHPKRTFIPRMQNFEEPKMMNFVLLAKKVTFGALLLWTRISQQGQIEPTNSPSNDGTNLEPPNSQQIEEAMQSQIIPQCDIYAFTSVGNLIVSPLSAIIYDQSRTKKQHKENDVSFRVVSKFKLKYQKAHCNLSFDFISHFTALLNPIGLFNSTSLPTSLFGLTTTPSFSCDFNIKEINDLSIANGTSGFASMFGESGLIVASTPWSSSFEVVDSFHGKTIFSSPEDSLPSSITAIAADGTYVITGAQDSSLCVWNTAKKRMTAQIRAHEHKVICVAYNDVCDLIASVDSAGVFSYSSVRSGNFTRSTKLSEFQKKDNTKVVTSPNSLTAQKSGVIQRQTYGRVLTKIEIASLGFVILFSEERNMMDLTTVLESFDFSQRRIELCKIPGKVTSSVLCVFQDGSQYLFVAMSTLKVFLYSVYELTRRAAYGEVSSPVRCCTFCRERNELFLSLENGDLLSYRFV